MFRAIVSLTLTIALLVTSMAAASARGAPPAVDRVVICAAHGISVVYLDAEGAPTKPPHLCPDCVMHLAAPLPHAQPAPLFEITDALVYSWRRGSQDVRPVPRPFEVRGPPLLSI